jgi:hypothetical protein
MYRGQHPVGLDLRMGARDDTGEEALQLGEKRLLVAECRGKVRAGQLHEAGAWNVLGQVAPAAAVPSSPVLPVHDQRRDANQRKDVAHVHFDVHPDVGGSRTGADTEPKDTGNALELLLRRARVAHGDDLGGEGGIPPAPLEVVGPSLRLLPGRKPRQAGALHETRRRVHQDQPSGPLGIRGREQDGKRGGVAEAEEHCPLRPDRVEDGADVVHARLQRGHPHVPVGHAGPSLVDPAQATDGGESG